MQVRSSRPRVTRLNPIPTFLEALTSAHGAGIVANYDVTPDGQRFLMLRPISQKNEPVTEIHVVLNWSEDLKRLAPAKQP